jgi:hypothetical protein
MSLKGQAKKSEIDQLKMRPMWAKRFSEQL